MKQNQKYYLQRNCLMESFSNPTSGLYHLNVVTFLQLRRYPFWLHGRLWLLHVVNICSVLSYSGTFSLANVVIDSSGPRCRLNRVTFLFDVSMQVIELLSFSVWIIFLLLCVVNIYQCSIITHHQFGVGLLDQYPPFINYPPHQWGWGGYTGFTLSVCLSICLTIPPSVCL